MTAEAVAADARAATKQAEEAEPAAAIKAVPAAPQVRRRRASGRAVEIFDLGQLEEADQAASGRKDSNGAVYDWIEQAKRGGGMRKVPAWSGLDRRLNGLRAKFPNMKEAIDRLAAELAVAAAMRPAHFRVTPLVLVGEPGLGKTYFARTLAEALGVQMDVVSAGGAQGGFVLAGTSAHWSNSAPGAVAKLLAKAEHASPVLVIDEVDKLSGDSRYPVLPALLDLLEPVSARAYRDECVEVRFDASKLIVILTANDLDLVPDPLKSRVEVIHVPRPDVAQRRQIVHGEWASLREHTRRKIDLPAEMAQALAEREDLDLRKTTRLIRDSFARALMSKEGVAKLELPAAMNKRTLGFVS